MNGKLRTLEQRKVVWGYLFLLPSILGFALFTAFPVLFSLMISFTNWNVVSSFKFVGLSNYIQLVQDKVFVKALFNTFYFTILTLPTGIALALLMAVALNKTSRAVRAYRTVVFLPVVTSMVSVAMVWSLLLNTDYGIINSLLSQLGFERISWLSEPRLAMISIALMSIWKGLGYTMTIYLAGLQGIPDHLYEASAIDGATKVRQFFSITLPMLRPTTFFVVVISMIGSLQIFDQVYIMTGGGPADATQTIVMYLYTNAFRYLKMGYASAMAYVLFVLIMGVSIIQYMYGKKRGDV